MQKAQPAAQLLSRQSSTYRGGWPQGFISTTCSGDAPVKCQQYESYNINCCPTGQTCSSNWPVYCCPTKENCETVVMNLPACANSSWNMFQLPYQLDHDSFFCCPKGMIGIIPSTGRTGICQENVTNIPADILATSASQFGNTLTTTSPEQPAGTGNNRGGGGDGSGTINTPSGGDNPNGGGGTNGNTNTGSSASASGGSAISPGAIAGIVIGALIILILGLALVLWIHRQSLRRNPPGMVIAAHPPPPQSPKPVGVTQVRPLVPNGGGAPEVVQYAGGHPGIPIYSAPRHATLVQGNGVSVVGFEGDIVGGGGEGLPGGAAPAYSPPLEVSGVGRVEMEVPRG